MTTPKKYSFLLFAFNDKIQNNLHERRMNHPTGGIPTLYTGFSHTGVVTSRLDQSYPLAINEEVFEPGLSYLNYLIEPLELYLTHQEIRDLTKLNILLLNPCIQRFDKYGHFFFRECQSTYLQVDPEYV